MTTMSAAMSATTMSAAVIHELGPADSIALERIPIPAPGPDDVLVRVAASAVDPVDTFVRSGAYRTPMTFPFVIGRDLVGTVDRGVGSEVDDFRQGDAVWCSSLGHGGRQGAASEWALVPADRLYRVPAGVDPIALVALAHPASTAWLALVEHGKLARGGTLFVGGGGGNVGTCAVAFAHALGARVVVTASAADVSRLRAAGAEAIDYRSPDLDALVAAALPDGADVWLDTSGTLRLAQALPRLAARGRIVMMSGITRTDALPFGELYPHDRGIVGFAISNASVDELARAAHAVGRAAASGVLHTPEVEQMGLDRAAEAHAALESGDAKGRRLLLVP